MKIVLAYSGGLDTSVILSWIKEKYDAKIIAFCANIGQEEELRGLEAKAKRTGDRKSTRLNSSHLGISYAVFCLKKKNYQITDRLTLHHGNTDSLHADAAASL